MKTISWETYEFDFNKPQKDSYDLDLDQDEDEMLEIDVPVLMNTPFGLFRVDDSMNPFKRFEFRMGHTNFDITPSVMEKIQSVPGVEVLVVNTRYRFIVATGQLFNFRDVRIAIEREVCGKHEVHFILNEIKNDTIREKVHSIYKSVQNSEHWVIYVFPNGSVEYYESKNLSDDFIQKDILLTYASQISGGVLIKSES